jgi:hypothetical protein
MKKTWALLLEHSFKIMIGGFILSAVCLLGFMKFRYGGGTLRTVFFDATIGALVVTIFGRLLTIAQKQAKKQTREAGTTREDS